MKTNGLSLVTMRRINPDGDIGLLEYMGSDATIASAARVSRIGATSDTGPTTERDAKLVRYLYRERHTSPFEHVRLRFRVSCPIFVARQWLRHRTGSFNEISARYAELPMEFWEPVAFRRQSNSGDKQASAEVLREGLGFEELRRAYEGSAQTYNLLISKGVSREMARAVLPVGIFTEFVWSVDLHNLFHFIDLRTTEHAQPEIKVYADRILELIRPIVPVAVEAFEGRGDSEEVQI